MESPRTCEGPKAAIRRGQSRFAQRPSTAGSALTSRSVGSCVQAPDGATQPRASKGKKCRRRQVLAHAAPVRTTTVRKPELIGAPRHRLANLTLAWQLGVLQAE